MDTIIPRVKPEDEELAKKQSELAHLETQLADRELSLATLRTELSAFEGQYLKIVGTCYAELDEINAQIAERLARQQLDNVEYQETAKQSRRQAVDSRSAAEAYVDREQGRALSSPELKGAYREVAKRVHPDLSSTQEDRQKRERLMAEANRAYEMGDLARLKRILEEYDTSPDGVTGEGTGAELVRTIRKIAQVQKRLSEIAHEIETTTGSHLATLKAKSEAYEQQGRNLLVEMAEQVAKQIAKARQRANRIPR